MHETNRRLRGGVQGSGGRRAGGGVYNSTTALSVSFITFYKLSVAIPPTYLCCDYRQRVLFRYYRIGSFK